MKTDTYIYIYMLKQKKKKKSLKVSLGLFHLFVSLAYLDSYLLYFLDAFLLVNATYIF